MECYRPLNLAGKSNIYDYLHTLHLDDVDRWATLIVRHHTQSPLPPSPPIFAIVLTLQQQSYPFAFVVSGLTMKGRSSPAAGCSVTGDSVGYLDAAPLHSGMQNWSSSLVGAMIHSGMRNWSSSLVVAMIDSAVGEG